MADDDLVPDSGPLEQLERRLREALAQFNHLVEGPIREMEAFAAAHVAIRFAHDAMVRGSNRRFTQMTFDNQNAALQAMEQVERLGPKSLNATQVRLLYLVGSAEAVIAAEEAERD